jgi:hypothetical protein
MTFDPHDGSASLRDPDLMTLTQTAKFLRVRPTDVMTAVREGEIPVHRVGQRLWFSRGEVIQSMQNTRRHDENTPPDGGPS